MSLKVEEAAKFRRLGMTEEEFNKLVVEKTDDRFNEIYRLVFGYVEQPDGSQKLMSKLPNGKVVFPDKSEKLERIKPGVPYLCLVYEREREAFAKILSEEYEPRIFVQPNGIVSIVWRKDNGEIEHRVVKEDTYVKRLIAALKFVEEELRVPDVRITFRKYEKEYRGGKKV